jgi:hypothetical protein
MRPGPATAEPYIRPSWREEETLLTPLKERRWVEKLREEIRSFAAPSS